MPEEKKCRSCGAPIFWAVGEVTGKRTCLDFTPVPKGAFVIRERGRDIRYAHRNVYDDPRWQPGTWSKERYDSHFATCPDAKDWRKP